MHTSHTNRKPSIATTALNMQITEVSMNSGIFFWSIIGRHLHKSVMIGLIPETKVAIVVVDQHEIEGRVSPLPGVSARCSRLVLALQSSRFDWPKLKFSESSAGRTTAS